MVSEETCKGISMNCYVFGLALLVGGGVVIFYASSARSDQAADSEYTAAKDRILSADTGSCTLGSALAAPPNCTVNEVCTAFTSATNGRRYRCQSWKERADCKCPVNLSVPSAWGMPIADVLASSDLMSVGTWDSDGTTLCEAELRKLDVNVRSRVGESEATLQCGLLERNGCGHGCDSSSQKSIAVPCLMMPGGELCLDMSKTELIKEIDDLKGGRGFMFDHGYLLAGLLLACGVIVCIAVFLRQIFCARCIEADDEDSSEVTEMSQTTQMGKGALAVRPSQSSE